MPGQLTKGITFAIEDSGVPGTFLDIGEITDLTFPTGSASIIDTTTLADTFVRKISGLPDEGQATVTLNNDSNNANALLLRAARAATSREAFQVVYPAPAEGGATVTADFNGFVLQYETAAAQNDKQILNVTIEIDGQVAYT